MTRTGRNSLLLFLVGLLVASVSLTALGAEEGDEGAADDTTTTTVASGLTPAVEMGGSEQVPADVDWTYRYLVPTGLALAAIIVLVTAVKYFTDVVRKRYRIVEE